jgi:hypothetical protein
MRTALEVQPAHSESLVRQDAEQITTLLFAAEPLATQIGNLLEQQMAARVIIAPTHLLCLSALRTNSFDLLLLEENALALDPSAACSLYESAGTAVIAEINFGVMRAESVLLAAKAALRRRKQEQQRARIAALSSVRADLLAPLTGLLLESQLALRQASPALAPSLQRIVELAEQVCARLQGSEHRAM